MLSQAPLEWSGLACCSPIRGTEKRGEEEEETEETEEEETEEEGGEETAEEEEEVPSASITSPPSPPSTTWSGWTRSTIGQRPPEMAAAGSRSAAETRT